MSSVHSVRYFQDTMMHTMYSACTQHAHTDTQAQRMGEGMDAGVEHSRWLVPSLAGS